MTGDILIVDDESAIRDVVGGILEDEGYQVRQAGHSDDAFKQLAKRRPALVLLDIWLEGSRLDGIQILDRIRAEFTDLAVIMLSGHGTIETAVAAIRKGAYDFIEKPFQADRLMVAVGNALETDRLRRQNAELIARTIDAKLIGTSPAIHRVRQTIDRVAPTGSRVLISGPPGSGKEIVARLVHQRSRRDDGPFVVLNAAALAPERVEAEIFGAEAGTLGSEQPRVVGAFERADGGTLVFDEIGDMPFAAQGKILRVLQEQSFSRIGSDVRLNVDARVIATTNKDLKSLMSVGRFREDLFYRINVVPIEVPPLDERRVDIPELVAYFVEQTVKSSGIARREIGRDALAVLQTAAWPGDVRQLRNVVEWMLIMAPDSGGQPLGVDDLPPELTNSAAATMDPKANGELVAMPLREAREQFERTYLQAQLQRFGGNISRTAGFVGMERSALHRKLKSLGLHSDD
ncbi:MAG: sigma-54 dependent transcriptional regulator [Pseudomonadota bacterium]